MTDEEIQAKAIEFAKQNKRRIANEMTDPKKRPQDAISIAIFMAGSPGAGKTELSTRLIENLEKGPNSSLVRIDTDEFRKLIPGYNGKNSYLFQKASSDIANAVFDRTMERERTFILDGTFSDYPKAVDNINRALRHYRLVIIFYVYQEPRIAWELTEAREKIEERNIPKSEFIRKFLGARDTVERINSDFKNKPLVVFLVKKNFHISEEKIVNISMPGIKIDDYLPERYTEEELRKIL